MGKKSKQQEQIKESSGNLLSIILIIVLVVAGFGFLMFRKDSAGSKPDTSNYSEKDLPPVIDGKQKSVVTVNSSSYSPKVTVLRQGIPAEITFLGQGYGCSTAVVSRDFWKGVVSVDYGKENVVSFTPEEKGTFRFTCTMGMYSGWFEVI